MRSKKIIEFNGAVNEERAALEDLFYDEVEENKESNNIKESWSKIAQNISILNKEQANLQESMKFEPHKFLLAKQEKINYEIKMKDEQSGASEENSDRSECPDQEENEDIKTKGPYIYTVEEPPTKNNTGPDYSNDVYMKIYMYVKN